jgi:hypothetical protein
MQPPTGKRSKEGVDADRADSAARCVMLPIRQDVGGDWSEALRSRRAMHSYTIFSA